MMSFWHRLRQRAVCRPDAAPLKEGRGTSQRGLANWGAAANPTARRPGAAVGHLTSDRSIAVSKARRRYDRRGGQPPLWSGLITMVGIKLLVDPFAPIVTSEHLTVHESSRDGPSRNDDPPKVPDSRPCRLRPEGKTCVARHTQITRRER